MAGFVTRLSRRPFLGSIRSGTRCAPIPLSKNSATKSSTEYLQLAWTNRGTIHRVKHREIIADGLSKAGWSLGWVSALDLKGGTIWIRDGHRDGGKRFVVHAE